MSKRTNPHKQAMKKHAAAMHNARYTLGKEFDALERGRQHLKATEANGGMGVVVEPSSVATGTLAEFIENCAPGDVYVERGIEVVKTDSRQPRLTVEEEAVEFLNNIGAYPVSVSSNNGVQIDPSKPVEISFAGHEPRDYQVPMVKALEGEHLPKKDFGEPVFIIDSISDMSKVDIEGTATVVEEPKVRPGLRSPALERTGFLTPELPEEVLGTVKKFAGEE